MKMNRLVRELWRSTPGKLGLVLLTVLILASLAVIITYPRDFGRERWSNPALWADSPKAVPPVWSNIFTSMKHVKHRIGEFTEPSERIESERATELIYEMEIDLREEEAPTFLSLSVSDVEFNRRPPILTVSLLRPDGAEVVLYRHTFSGPRRGEEAPYTRHQSEPHRVLLGDDEGVVDALSEFYVSRYNQEVARDDIRSSVEAALFGIPGKAGGEAAEAEPGAAANADAEALGGVFQVLNGRYVLLIHFLTMVPEDTIGFVKGVAGGAVFGAMGTDALGRDLAKGLLFGLPVALLIGISTATVSTLIGMSLGMVSGYAGGKTDIAIQRAADIVANVPVLPLLIFLVFIGGSQLWLILLILVAFSWPGLTIMIRTMVLQLRTGQEVEAAKALGASGGRIITRHILPHVASYILAQLVFFAPSAILAEAGLSFLGLGDPTIPTWGQILEYGFRTGAVFLGYWWWVIPPGLLIVLTAVTFMFLAQGLEPVVDPRLRGRRSWHF
jgi:peptide/nickel transport system permease protein